MFFVLNRDWRFEFSFAVTSVLALEPLEFAFVVVEVWHPKTQTPKQASKPNAAVKEAASRYACVTLVVPTDRVLFLSSAAESSLSRGENSASSCSVGSGTASPKSVAIVPLLVDLDFTPRKGETAIGARAEPRMKNTPWIWVTERAASTLWRQTS